MNYYEICRDGLKLLISTNICNLDKKMARYINNYFLISDYNKNNALNELVILDVIKYDNLCNFQDNYFVMAPNTYIFSNIKNKIMFVYDEFDDTQCLNLKRIIIDIFSKYYECNGTCFVHGASVVNKKTNKATVFIGSTGSGKTTNLLFYLLSGNYDYMGNDRIGLKYSNEKLMVNGFPSNIGLRYPTLELNERLKNIILPYLDQSYYSKIINQNIYSKKLNLNIYDLLSAFNCKSVAQSELSELIITDYDKSIKNNFFIELSNEKILREIEKQTISAVSKEQYFLNYLLEFEQNDNFFSSSNIDILAYKSNLHPNCNKTLVNEIRKNKL